MNWVLATIDDLDFIVSNIKTEEVRIASGLSKMARNAYVRYTTRLLELPEYQTWMQVKDGKLDQYFTLYNLKTLPYYVIFNYRKIATPDKLFGLLHQQWDELLDFVVPMQEKNNFYSFYTLRVSARSGRKFIFDRRTQNMQEDLNSFHERYFKVVEEYIPNGQVSKYETFQKLMFRGLEFNEDVFVTKYICKQSARSNIPLEFQENLMQLEKNIEDKVNQQKENSNG
jgi:hypothetical protein